MKIATAFLVLLLALPAPAGDDVLQLYDIRDLVKSENRPATEIAARIGRHIEGITKTTVEKGVLAVTAPAAVQERITSWLTKLRDGKNDVLRIFPIDDLVTSGMKADVIAAHVRKLSDKAKVQVHKGSRLIIAAPAEVQREIDTFLRELREKARPIVAISARILGGTNEEGTRFLDPAALKEFLEKAAKSASVTILAAPRLSCFNGQRASIALGKERSCVRDLEVVFEEENGILVDPVIEKVFEGIRLEIRPIVSLDRKHVTLVVDATLSRVVDEPKETRSPETSERVVEIQIPDVRQMKRRTAVTLPLGHGVLVDLGTNRLLLRAELVKHEGAEEHGDSGK